MSRKRARRVAARPPEPVAAPTCHEIPEDAFHRACRAATAHTNTFAGETFTTPDAVYARINDRHFRLTGAAALSHAQSLALIGRSPAWRREHRR